MDVLHTIALAIIQGLTEFLPVSSSAHLILPSRLLGWPDQGIAFDIAVHIGTLLAVLLFFYRDIAAITAGWCRRITGGAPSDESNLGWAIIIATLPIMLVGEPWSHWVEPYMRSTLVIAASTIVFGLVLWWADRRDARQRTMAEMNWKSALAIGLAQILALIPGTSRSGITLTAGLMLNFSREAAARFSFLLSIPTILAAALLKSAEMASEGGPHDWGAMLLGALVSFVAGLLCIKAFMALIQRVGLLPFVIYRLLLGVLLLIFSGAAFACG
ncbi:undecaprenyl-diphosphate phosphatase [Carnimonas nigrificans]|uniref:undecaprenyl-diphosphate phosphatase n=1 Tax=Carnimonas nigrificans TaxID=64323 RepID=UPI00046E661B|nr:undecaprenyl-diphosphate phosphatase [Carnimonas nigrificans]